MYTIVPTPQYLRAYQKLSREIQLRADKAHELLKDNPKHPSLHTHKRKGEDGVWQARVTRSYRTYFHLEGDVITLLEVIPHEK